MANFRTHIGFGVFVGIIFILFGLIYSLFTSPEWLGTVFLAVLIGSFLPDLDMDRGLPFQIIFGLAGAVTGGIVFLGMYSAGEQDWIKLIFFPFLFFGLVRFGGGYIFEKFTNHRGMFHSVPAAVLFGLLTIWLLNKFAIFQQQKLFLGLAISVGYLGHLILDEIYASVNLKGGSIFPKQSLGGALKFYSSSKWASLAFYVLIFILVLNLPDVKDLQELFSGLWRR